MPLEFSDLDTLTFEQKDQLLLLVSSVLSAAETEHLKTISAGVTGERRESMLEMVGLVQLRQKINDNRAALQRSPSVSTTTLLEPVIRFMRNS